MTGFPSESSKSAQPSVPGRDLESVMAEFLERTERGETPRPDDYLAEYPHLADELGDFFGNLDWFAGGPADSRTDRPLATDHLAGPSEALIGTRIGPYEIESEIARGGMGVVYRARQKGLDRPVALKLISSGVLAGREERRRFRIEAEAAARLQHVGIIAIHEIGSWQGYEYFSMPLVDGPTLQHRIDQKAFDDVGAAEIVRDIARAVAYAHRAGIVHRDLKPENILIGQDGRPLLTDFGLAKWHREGTMMTRTGQVLGTPNYMSPEQACGRGDGDTCTDIYSLGAILYALLSGRPPHMGASAAEVLRSVLQDEPQAPRHHRRDVDPALERICLKAIRFEPAARYATADALADDLQRYLAGEVTSAEGSGLLDRVAREIRRDQHQLHFVNWHRTLVTLGIVIFVAHLSMTLMRLAQWPTWLSFWTPRLMMFAFILGVIFRARGGSLTPRTVAERPVYSIWIGYLATLTVMNVFLWLGGLDPATLFPVAAALGGFGFIAMAGHIWGGAAILGIAFELVAIAMVFAPDWAALMLGTTWLASLSVLANHYRISNPHP